jgi:hypothetical protein
MILPSESYAKTIHMYVESASRCFDGPTKQELLIKVLFSLMFPLDQNVSALGSEWL